MEAFMNEKWRIRVFEKQDEGEVIALWRACNLVVPWNDPKKDIQRKLKVNPELFIVGILDGNIIASVMGGYEGHRGWVNYLAVSPLHRKKAMGGKSWMLWRSNSKRWDAPRSTCR
jgi:predicted transcriptional regulator